MRPGFRPALARHLQVSLDELDRLLAGDRAPAVFGLEFVSLEKPTDILSRLYAQDAALTDDALDGLELFLDDVANRYEENGPRILAPEVVQQRLVVQRLMADARPSRRGLRLLNIAARLSGQLGYMAVNLGDFSAAGAYGLEAFHLADEVGDDQLKAWVRGTQSFAEYYRGRYRKALELAQDGRRYAGRSHEAVRLAVNGEARALAQLGEPEEARLAIGQAYDLLERFDAELGVSSCISFGVYSEARVASNAATAYLALGDTTAVLRHAERSKAVVDQSPSRWSQSLVRLDAATALAQGPHADPERAVELAREAITLSADRPVESVRQRTRAFSVILRAGPQTQSAAGESHLVV